MNRPLKFRSKDRDGQWAYFGVFNNFDKEFLDEETLGEFTGLTDTEGREIYEGDRVSFRVYSGMENGHYEEFEREIRWEDTGWNFTKYEVEEGCKVVGNVYEN